MATMLPNKFSYIELKSGFTDNGPAWICRTTTSKSGRTVYFNNKALKKSGGAGISGNHYDLETGEEYWVSGIKKNGEDRHFCEKSTIYIEEGIVRNYLEFRKLTALEKNYMVISDLPKTDIKRLQVIENR